MYSAEKMDLEVLAGELGRHLTLCGIIAHELFESVQRQNTPLERKLPPRGEVKFNPGPPPVLRITINEGPPRIRTQMGITRNKGYSEVRAFWKRLVRRILDAHRAELEGFRTFPRAVVYAIQYLTRPGDADQYLWKILNDALVECRVIQDDRSDSVLWIPYARVDKDRAPGVKILVFDDQGEMKGLLDRWEEAGN